MTTNAEAHRAIYSQINGGVAHLSDQELWDTIEQARIRCDFITLDKARAELDRRQRAADRFTAWVEKVGVLGAMLLCALFTAVFLYGLYKLLELWF